MDTIKIKYTFNWDSNREDVFDLALDADTLDIISPHPDHIPHWAELNFHQCPSCTLDIGNDPHCPLAVNLVDINTLFTDLVSYEKVHVEVATAERTIIKDTTAQDAISSLMGLIIPCSGCPHTQFFKPMARFHLPFASEMETIFRATSMYLLAQYFVKKKREKPILN